METSRASLRREFREARTGLNNPGTRARLDAHILKLLADLQPASVGAYFPMAEEAPLEPRKEYAYPAIHGDTLLFFRAHGTLLKNKFGIPEPDPKSSDAVIPELILSPAVAVDGLGNRLGMGRGYYDRYFSRHAKAIRVGVVYQVQVSRLPLPAEEWDQPLDWIVTDQMILRTQRRSA